MTNETYWALKRREWASRQQRPSRRPRTLPLRRPSPPLASPVPAPIPAETLEETVADIVEAEEPSYRDLQAEAKELGIKANQPADKLKKAIEKA
jgi:hypothetical protein